METDYLNFNNLLDNKHHKLCQVTSEKLFSCETGQFAQHQVLPQGVVFMGF
jgi:hypothetical protein